MRKTNLLLLIGLNLFFCIFTSTATAEDNKPLLQLESNETVNATYGVKSVLISLDGSRVYSMNLEGMSVYEFDRKSRKLLRKLAFIPTKGKGFDYDKKIPIDSFQEKPVEATLTHNGRYLWISLHNAGGVVIWDLNGGETYCPSRPYRKVKLYDFSTVEEKPIVKQSRLLFIKTGKTPKVITVSPDGKYVFVSNWHSNNVSIITTISNNPADWTKVKDISSGTIPRGLAVSKDSKTLYIALTGGSGICVVDIADMKKTGEITAGINPRHVITDGKYLYVTLNSESRLVKINTENRKVDAQTETGKSPRTACLSKDGKYVFLVCYLSNTMQAFSASDLRLLGEWESSEHPIGLDIYEDSGITELWTCNYLNGTLRVFDFRTP
jgi:YVTN family beta-propeller protein